MKHFFSKLLILIPLILIAGGAFAAYSFVGPTAAPTSNNTDGPLDISATDQIKNGGLAVNTFQSRSGADFVQQSQFTGLVNGGTANATSSTVSFGNTTDKTSVNVTGNTAIVGNYQSDSLKTGGGLKPLCADSKGVFYICGVTPPANTTPIYLYANTQTVGSNTYASASISEPTNTNISVTLSAVSNTGGGGTAFSQQFKNMYTANAYSQGQCRYTTTPTFIVTAVIYAGSTTSSNTAPLATGCNTTNSTVYVSSYSPQTTSGGRKIIYTGNI